MTILVLMARPSSGWEIPGGVKYRAFVFEPIWGGRIALGKVEKCHVLPENFELSRTSFCPTSGPPTGYRPPQLPPVLAENGHPFESRSLRMDSPFWVIRAD